MWKYISISRSALPQSGFGQRPSCNILKFFRHKLTTFNPSRQVHSTSNLVGTILKSRSLIRLSGPDTSPFLQGLITNDISHLDPTTHQSIYALLLNHQGRILYDVILTSFTPGETLLECDSTIKQQLIKHLTLYRVKKKVEIVDADLSPWVVFQPLKYEELEVNSPVPVISNQLCTCSSPADEYGINSSRSDLTLGDYKGVSDPRLCELGWRFILPKGQTLGLTPGTETDYRKLLISLGVGEGVKDSPVGSSFPLESNGDYLHGVSFHKGCYVGQELTARTHHTGVVRKRLMPFMLPPGTSFPPDTDISKLEIKNPATGRPVGKVRNILDIFGLALTRIDEALSAGELRIGDIKVTVKKPNWWPVELSKETSVKK